MIFKPHIHPVYSKLFKRTYALSFLYPLNKHPYFSASGGYFPL